LTEADVFVLSIMYAVDNGLLPENVVNQFPRKKACKQAR